VKKRLVNLTILVILVVTAIGGTAQASNGVADDLNGQGRETPVNSLPTVSSQSDARFVIAGQALDVISLLVSVRIIPVQNPPNGDEDDEDEDEREAGSGGTTVVSINGAAIYAANCGSCHGVNTARATTRTQAQLLNWIPNHYTGGNLTASDVTALATYIKS